MAEVLCSLCTCRLEWNDVDADELMCSLCGHSLDDDHAAAAMTKDAGEIAPLKIFAERKVI